MGWIMFGLHGMAYPALIVFEGFDLEKVAAFSPKNGPRSQLASEFVLEWAFILYQMAIFFIGLLLFINPYDGQDLKF